MNSSSLLRKETTYLVIQPNDFKRSQLVKGDPDPSATQKWKRLGYSLDQFVELISPYTQLVHVKYTDLEEKITQVIEYTKMTPETVGDSVEVFSSKTSQIMMVFVDYYSTPNKSQTVSLEIPEEDAADPIKLQQHLENYYKQFKRVATEPVNALASTIEPTKRAIHGTVLLEQIQYPVETFETLEVEIDYGDLLNVLIDSEEVTGWKVAIDQSITKHILIPHPHTFKFDIMNFSLFIAYNASMNKDLHEFLMEQDRLNHTDVPGMEAYDNSDKRVEYVENPTINLWMTDFLKPMMNGNPFFGDAYIYLQEITHFRDIDKTTIEDIKHVIVQENYEIKEEDYEQKRDELNRVVYNNKYRLLYKYSH